jgi:hypothetical protein
MSTSPSLSSYFLEMCQSVTLVMLRIFVLFCQDDDSEEMVKDSVKKNQCNFITLSAWYKEQMKCRSLKSPRPSPRKKSKSKQILEVDKGPVLVIIIPNVEGFSSQILQHFILIAR